MRYVPDGPAIDKVPHLRVGLPGAVRSRAVLTLGVEPGAPVTSALGADTAVGIVLNLLTAPDRAALVAGAEAATSATFSGDHLLAVWALTDRDGALSRRRRLVEVARAAAFHIADSDEIAQIACFLKAYPEEAGSHEPASLYAELLPRVSRLLDAPKDFDLDWIGEYSDVLRANSLLHSGAVQIEDFPEIDLSIVETPLRLHDLTRTMAVSMYRVLTIRSENTYTLEYRRESWVQFPRGPRPARIDLRPLAHRLNLFERSGGAWRADPVSDPTPRMYLDDGRGGPSPSTIDASTVRSEVMDYLQAAPRRPDLLWTPYG